MPAALTPAKRFGGTRRSGQGRKALLALAIALLFVEAAGAHVSVEPGRVGVNSFATFLVRVPNEKELPTVAVRIEFPAGLTVTRFQSKPGWKRAIEQDAASRIIAATWSEGQIADGEYDDFTFLARTPREPGTLIFKSYQTYQDGETVAWVGAEGDELPAAFVEVVDAAAAATNSDVAPSLSETPGPVPADATPSLATTAAGELNSTITDTVTVPDPSAVEARPPSAGVGETPTAAADVAMAPAAAATSVAGAASAPDSSRPAVSAAGAAVDAGEEGSDLALFIALTALVAALCALALAGVSLARKRPGF